MKKKPSKKKKKKLVPKQNVPCHCEYDHRLSNMFEEVFTTPYTTVGAAEGYHDALMHSDSFQFMLGAIHEFEMDASSILSDAVRFGCEMGRRLAEVDKLEDMVKYEEGKNGN